MDCEGMAAQQPTDVLAVVGTRRRRCETIVRALSQPIHVGTP